ncbi:hypothetical protein MRX96_008304 [Rhipicephalus microplus]
MNPRAQLRADSRLWRELPKLPCLAGPGCYSRGRCASGRKQMTEESSPMQLVRQTTTPPATKKSCPAFCRPLARLYSDCCIGRKEGPQDRTGWGRSKLLHRRA